MTRMQSGARERPWTKASALVVALLVASPATVADVVVIPAAKDNTLYESRTGGLSNGSGQRLFAGRTGSGGLRRGLVEFDISGNVPAGSIISGATLTLNLIMTTSGPQTVSLHRVLADWGEGPSDAPGGEGIGTSSTPGDATWIHTFFDTDFWSNAGGDFVAVPGSSGSVAGEGLYSWGPEVGMTADVQGWLDDSGGNHGWILIGNEAFLPTAKAFASKEHPVPTLHPTLTVEFLIVTDDEDEDGDEDEDEDPDDEFGP